LTTRKRKQRIDRETGTFSLLPEEACASQDATHYFFADVTRDS